MRIQRVAAVVLAAALSASCHGESDALNRRPRRPDILLVTIDTLRADRIGRGIAPTLDRLASAGVQFTAARTAAPLTLPSHTTMMTGLLPPAHGVRDNGAVLPDTPSTLAQLMKNAGYRTAAFVGAFVLDRRFGLARGFDSYDDAIRRDPNATERLEAERPAAAVVDAALRWLERPASGTETAAPFFVWVHLYDPHAPYTPPPPYSGYDGEVSYADAQLARLLGRVDRKTTAIIVAGDHGEGLGEHGENTHGMLLYDSTLRVPLIVALPGSTASVRDEPVSLVDLAPTILGAAGVQAADTMVGRNLLGGAREGDIYAETQYPRVAGWSPLQALTDARWKTIRAGGDTEVFDLAADPQERTNLAATQSSTAAAMIARIEAIGRRGRSASAAPAVSAEAQQRLRALGYVASSSPVAAAGNAPNPSRSIDAWNAFEEALSTLNVDANKALPALERLAAAHPDAPVFQTTRARALRDAGRTMAALAAYRAAARRWPSDAMVLHDLAVAAKAAADESRGNRALIEEAEKAERAAVALDPANAVARNGLGLLAIDQGRAQDAIREFAGAVERDPNNASYRANLGNARRAAGDAAGAEQAYRAALEVDPQSVDAANGLGVLLVEQRRAADAVPWLERAVAAAPGFVEARLNLAIARQQSGDMKRAAEAYRAVLASPGEHAREKQAARELLAALGASR
jgi:arylsulfatase A-like enzyme/Tfp pilus assembly protein PilF